MAALPSNITYPLITRPARILFSPQKEVVRAMEDINNSSLISLKARATDRKKAGAQSVGKGGGHQLITRF